MKHKEKLDIVLRGLYRYKFDGKYYPILQIIEEQGLAYGNNEPRHIAKRLNEDGYAKMVATKDRTSVCITSKGVEYCEQDSYALPGSSIINIYNIDSTNSNLNIGSGNQNVKGHSNKQIDDINEIKKELAYLKEVDNALVKEISECLDEIEEKIQQGKKVSSVLFRGLLAATADLTTIYPLMVKLYNRLF